MMDDQLLTRIANVSNFYRGAHYHLSFCSEEGGVWAYELVASSPPPEDENEEGLPPGIYKMLFGAVRNAPVFAIRCQYLETITEALESWHSKALVEGVNDR